MSGRTEYNFVPWSSMICSLFKMNNNNTHKVTNVAVKGLTLSTLGKISSRRHFEIFFLFFPESNI